jgi:hypothetical protein
MVHCTFPHILGSPFSNMTLQLIHSEFFTYDGKFEFLFYQCTDGGAWGDILKSL